MAFVYFFKIRRSEESPKPLFLTALCSWIPAIKLLERELVLFRSWLFSFAGAHYSAPLLGRISTLRAMLCKSGFLS
jgi:hypothetical protein